MSHLDPDRLPLIAVGDLVSDEVEAAHLGDCAECRETLRALREVAVRGKEAPRVRNLPAPPERVWQRIAGELASRQPAPPAVRNGARRNGTWAGSPYPEPTRPGRRTRGRLGSGRRRPELVRLGLVAVAAAVLAATGTLGVAGRIGLDREPGTERGVTAQAVLAPPDAGAADAHGAARVLDDRTLHLHVTGLEPHPGYHEVWLINPDTMEMISVGVLGDGTDVVLPLPPTVDLGSYRLVDISAEAYDSDPGHSGDSLVRGTLRG